MKAVADPSTVASRIAPPARIAWKDSYLPWVLLGITTCIALIYFSWGINSWRFSFVGDEWAFYTEAKDIAARHLLVNPFNPAGVYDSYTVLGSYYQAIFLAVLGTTNVAWRFSNTFLIVPMSLCCFQWLRRPFGLYAALAGTTILQAAFFLANFFKIGYVNPQALALLLVCLLVAQLAGAEPTGRHMAFLGVSLGVSAYIYIGPLFLFIVWPYLLPILSRHNRTWRVGLNVLLFVALYCAFVVPLLLNATHWAGLARSTVLTPQYHDPRGLLANIADGFLVFYHSAARDHFIYGPYLDVVSRTLAVVGLIVAMVNIILDVKRKEYAFLVLSYVSAVVLISTTSPYSPVPPVRALHFIVFGAAFAGIGLTAFWPLRRWFVVAPVLAVIFAINLYDSQVGAFEGFVYNPTTLIVQALQEAQGSHTGQQIVFQLSRSHPYNYQVILDMRTAYGLDDVPFMVSVRPPRCDTLRRDHVLALKDDPVTVQALDALPCTHNGDVRVTVF